MIIIYDSSARDKVRLILQLVRKTVRIAQLLLMKLAVNTFIRALFKHFRTDVEPNDILILLIAKVLTHEASATSKVNNFHVGWIHARFSGEFFDEICHVFWVGIAHSEIHAFIVGRDVVEMLASMLFLILVACFNQI